MNCKCYLNMSIDEAYHNDSICECECHDKPIDTNYQLSPLPKDEDERIACIANRMYLKGLLYN